MFSSLENAYTPLTTPNDPGVQDNWLYTGRAFSLNPILLSAGWMAIQREDYNGSTYWRVFLKARFQDGSAGFPMSAPSWDVNARFAGDPRSYEAGGQPDMVQSGYWIDLTELAHRFGWERLESLPNWRSISWDPFQPIRHRDGLDWYRHAATLPAGGLATPPRSPLLPIRPPRRARQHGHRPYPFLPNPYADVNSPSDPDSRSISEGYSQRLFL